MNSVRLANKLYHPALAIMFGSIAIQILCLIAKFSAEWQP